MAVHFLRSTVVVLSPNRLGSDSGIFLSIMKVPRTGRAVVDLGTSLALRAFRPTLDLRTLLLCCRWVAIYNAASARLGASLRLSRMASKKVALITGITGQDGALLAELLLSKGYIVHGVKRRSSLINTDRVDHLYHDPHEAGVNFLLHYGDVTDSTNLILVQEDQPDEIYNLSSDS